MTKTNDSGVPFLGEKRVTTKEYEENYNKIDWSKHSKKEDKQESTDDSTDKKEKV